jgi:serine/threonine protein phosphatase PrpC
MRFTIYQESRTGSRRSNQDRVSYCYSRDALLMVVADGMGGHLYGEVAAQIAVQYITEAFQREAAPKLEDPTLFLSRALLNAHHAIMDYAGDHLLKDAPRTTCVACVVQDGSAHWAHAGDSRLYHLRKGTLAALTRDHSRVQQMVEQGIISQQEAAVHPARNRIYSCLGAMQPPQIEFSPRVRLADGDVLALCSDGLWGPLDTETIAATLCGTNVMTAVPQLMSRAEDTAGASCDNLSIVAMIWEDDQAGSDSTVISTDTMPLDHFTTQMEGFARSRAGTPPGTELSDEEIENAIEEIQAAIRKFTR